MSVVTVPRSTGFAWHVDSLTRADGVARVEPVAGGIRIAVADGVGRVPHEDDVTEAMLYADGRAVVRCHAAPPALLITHSGARLLPAAPLQECVVESADGDLLLMCSSAALEHLPAGLGGVLACSPLRVGAHDPLALLEHLMEETDVGAALIARCAARGPNEASTIRRTSTEEYR